MPGLACHHAHHCDRRDHRPVTPGPTRRAPGLLPSGRGFRVAAWLTQTLGLSDGSGRRSPLAPVIPGQIP